MAAVGVGAVGGTAIGFLAGYAGSWSEVCVMRIVDAMLAFPGLLAALAIITILGRGARNIGIAIAIFNVPGFVRLARAAMLAERYATTCRRRRRPARGRCA